MNGFSTTMAMLPLGSFIGFGFGFLGIGSDFVSPIFLSIGLGLLFFSMTANFMFKKENILKKVKYILFSIFMALISIGFYKTLLGTMPSEYNSNIFGNTNNINILFANIVVTMFPAILFIDSIFILIKENKKTLRSKII